MALTDELDFFIFLEILDNFQNLGDNAQRNYFLVFDFLKHIRSCWHWTLHF